MTILTTNPAEQPEHERGVAALWMAIEIILKNQGSEIGHFGRVSGAPGAARTPKVTDFRPLKI